MLERTGALSHATAIIVDSATSAAVVQAAPICQAEDCSAGGSSGHT